MKKKMFFLIFFGLLRCLSISLSINAFDLLLPKKDTKLFLTHVERRQERVESLSALIEKFEQKSEEFNDETKMRLEVIKNKIAFIKKDLEKMPDDEFLNKVLTILNEWYQTVKDLQQTREQLGSLIKEHKKMLTEYLQDSEQKQFKKELRLIDRVYTFEDLTIIKEKLDTLIHQKNLLEEQVKNTTTELDNRKRAATAVTKEFEQKRDLYKQDTIDIAIDAFALTTDQKKELFVLDEELYHSKQKLYVLQQEEVEQKRDLLRTKLFLTSSRIDILNEAFSRVKASIRITEAEVLYARSERKKEQQALNTKKQEIYDPEREAIEQKINQIRTTLLGLVKHYNITADEEMSSWSKMPSSTAESWLGYTDIGKINDQMLFLERKRDLLNAEIAKEEDKLQFDEIRTDMQDSFLKKDAGRFSAEEKITQEIRSYETRKTKTKAKLASVTGKKSTAQSHLDTQKKAADTIVLRLKELEEQKRVTFKGHSQEYVRVQTSLRNALHIVNEQIELLNKIISTYNDNIELLTKANEVIDFISLELESIRIIWQRPEHAISWAGIKRIVPDIERFALDVHAHVMLAYGVGLLDFVREVSEKPFTLLLFILQLIALAGFFFLLRKMLLAIKNVLSAATQNSRPIFKTISVLVLVIVNFVLDYVILISIWVTVFILLRLYILEDNFAYILFYLVSIPYLLLITNRFIAYLARANEWYGYQLVSKEFQRRCIVIFSILGYATVAIFFFRQAFVLGNYPKSELPNILLAINFIIFQISVIFLIAKEQILNIIPQTNDVWLWVREQVDQYYYLMLLCMVAIIVMINPYVGFGKLVLYILTHIIYTIILVVSFIWLHGMLKRSSSALFFQTEQDTVKERFVGAKTWYGVFIIGVLLSLLFFGAIIISKIWNWPVTLSNISNFGDIITWLQRPVLLEGTENPISLYTILYLLFFIVAGVVVSFLIKRFVLARIFDVLLVDAGVQYTVTSIMRYLVMLVAIIIGFNAVGLGQQMNLIIGAVIFGIAWVIKDPVGDFFAYFIILVQRPVKIGDFIKIDSEVTGVVRRITPRSVVLRRKNSTMIVVPNSYLMNKPIVNWNYSRGFIAFSDIIVTIDYDEDPLKVRDLLRQVVDENQFALKNPKPVIRLDDFGDYGYVFMIRGFLSSNYTLDQWNIASDIRLQIVKTCDKEGVKLALPIRVTVTKDAQRRAENQRDASEGLQSDD